MGLAPYREYPPIYTLRSSLHSSAIESSSPTDMAASTQALITLGSVSTPELSEQSEQPEQPLSNLSSPCDSRVLFYDQGLVSSNSVPRPSQYNS